MKNLLEKNFRIGNFVKARTTYDEYNVVKEIGFSDNQRGYYLRLEGVNHGVWLEHNGENLILGIPITEEWLVNFGFEKGFYYKKGCLKLSTGSKRTLVRYVISNSESVSIATIQYIHELQNLYFAITGAELELKNDVKKRIKNKISKFDCEL